MLMRPGAALPMKTTPLRRYTALRAKAGLKTYSRLTTSKPLKVGKGLRRRAHSTEPPTPMDQVRFHMMRKRGCIACMMNRARGIATATFVRKDLEIHHLLSGGVRIGHHATVCLCHFHHQGKRLPFLDHRKSVV